MVCEGTFTYLSNGDYVTWYTGDVINNDREGYNCVAYYGLSHGSQWGVLPCNDITLRRYICEIFDFS